ncbi:efflux RND transporter periplasmic adaptor subunit [Oscillatoria sp. FACHB-1407]|uniref:efflux RND transporter periplasmic adaptor subunit n=1 Tax=Oscillatoria sp. FACHB-1407 TaxID=2692847 RepID=UPI001687B0EF|nr:efflux RND transporter periplasmic adaptor subunit [Oscillatoria sp. FACHB-1407]MBD2464178.1 efflux RND transporter periplasmic adaptor subunit [Oscillatoria sp. FACHB-1407]
MTPPEPSNKLPDGSPSNATIKTTNDSDIAIPYRPSPKQGRPWLTALMVLLVLLGLGFGWQWWRSRSAGQAGGPPGAAQAQAAPVELETLQTGNVEEASEFVGTLESRNSVELSPEIDGRVSRIFVDPGDRVAAGQPLVELSADQRQAEYASVLASVNSARAIRANATSELQALQAERLANVAEVELQNAEYQRISALVSEGAFAQQQLDTVQRDRNTAIAQLNAIDRRIQASRANLAEAEAALAEAQANAAASNAQLQDTVISAPFAGTVGDIPVKLGDYVQAGDQVTSVTQSQELELEIAVPLERGSDLRNGQRVELLDVQGNPIGTGQLSFIAPQVNSAAQSILVKANFANPNGRLLAGQFVRARVIWSETSGILVPTAAISRLGGQTFVFVAERSQPQPGQPAEGQPQLIARQREVKLGDLQGNSYHVLEGLQPGEQIVTSGVLNLADGIPIMPMSDAPPAAPQPQ